MLKWALWSAKRNDIFRWTERDESVHYTASTRADVTGLQSARVMRLLVLLTVALSTSGEL